MLQAKKSKRSDAAAGALSVTDFLTAFLNFSSKTAASELQWQSMTAMMAANNIVNTECLVILLDRFTFKELIGSNCSGQNQSVKLLLFILLIVSVHDFMMNKKHTFSWCDKTNDSLKTLSTVQGRIYSWMTLTLH